MRPLAAFASTIGMFGVDGYLNERKGPQGWRNLMLSYFFVVFSYIYPESMHLGVKSYTHRRVCKYRCLN